MLKNIKELMSSYTDLLLKVDDVHNTLLKLRGGNLNGIEKDERHTVQLLHAEYIKLKNEVEELEKTPAIIASDENSSLEDLKLTLKSYAYRKIEWENGSSMLASITGRTLEKFEAKGMLYTQVNESTMKFMLNQSVEELYRELMPF